MAKNERTHYADLIGKIYFLIDDPVARSACGHRSTFSSFSKKAGVDRTQLAEAIGSPMGKANSGSRAGDNRLSDMNAERIAAACGFDARWREFLTGTVDEFKKKYYGHHKAGPARLKVVQEEEPWCFDSQLATLELFVAQGTHILFELICNPAPLEGVEVGVRRGRLQLDCGKARTSADETGRGSSLKMVELSAGDRTVVLSPGGTSRRPSWDIASSEGPIGILSLEEPICELFGVLPENVVSARFAVYFKDLEDSGPDDAQPVKNTPLSPVSLLRPGYRTLGSMAQKRICDRLRQLQLPDGDQGWAVLCRHSRKFERDSGGE